MIHYLLLQPDAVCIFLNICSDFARTWILFYTFYFNRISDIDHFEKTPMCDAKISSSRAKNKQQTDFTILGGAFYNISNNKHSRPAKQPFEQLPQNTHETFAIATKSVCSTFSKSLTTALKKINQKKWEANINVWAVPKKI